MTTKQDDFLAQILAAEKTATKKIETAKEQIRLDTEKYKKMLSEKSEKRLNIIREKAKKQLQTKQIAAKDIYRNFLSEAQKEVIIMEKEANKKEDKILSAAVAVFLNDII